MVIHAVIASIGHADETVFPLIETLHDEGVRVTVVDNRGTFPIDELSDQVLYCECPFANVYAAWNLGINVAEHHKADWCVVLNDDITLAPGAVSLAASRCEDPGIWIAGFDYEGRKVVRLREAVGSYRQHGVGGFAFMVRPNVGLRYDERFTWWGGDDDLVWTCLDRGGRAVVVEGAKVWHHDGGNKSGRHYPELADGIEADRDLLIAKWAKAW